MSLPMHLRAGFKIPPLRLSEQSDPIYLKAGRGKSKVEPTKLSEQPVVARPINLTVPATVVLQKASAQVPSIVSPDCSRYRGILLTGQILTGLGLMTTPVSFGFLSSFRDENSNGMTSGQYAALSLGGLSLATLATGAALLGVANRNKKCLKED